MYDLSLHILDVLENALRAGASTVAVTLQTAGDPPMLQITVEDNGPGLDVPADRALDPFYTTKAGKRTGLGLSLFRAAAERAGGRLDLDVSPLGGLRLAARLRADHVDRSPLGDVSATLASVALTHPELDLRVRLGSPEAADDIRLQEFAGRDAIERAALFADRVREAERRLDAAEPEARLAGAPAGGAPEQPASHEP